MKTGTVVLLGLAGLVLYEFQQLGTAVATVQFVFNGVQPKGLLKYTIQILVQNVSNATCQVNAMTGVVSINDNPVGNISDFQPVTVPGRGQQIVNIDLTVSVVELPSAVIDLLNNSGGNLAFNVTGNANVNGLILPFSLDKSISV